MYLSDMCRYVSECCLKCALNDVEKDEAQNEIIGAEKSCISEI